MTEKFQIIPSTPRGKLDAVGIDAVCLRIAELDSLRTIAKSIGISVWSLTAYLDDHAEQYTRARALQSDAMIEQGLEIVDDICDAETTADVQRARLRYDARRWYASKLAPKKYGDKIEISGDEKSPLVVRLVSGADDLIKKIRGTE